MQKMMASSSELTLDCKPQSHSLLLKSFGDHQQPQDHTQKLEEFLSRLEEERLKIDAFKRELPLCMQLLTNAMETSRLQLNNYRSNQVSRPVLEEFIPLKTSTTEGSEKASDKANWMTSAQLWSQGGDETKPPTAITSPRENGIGLGVGPKLDLDVTTQRSNGGTTTGAFLPFSKERNPSRALPELALVSVDKEMEDKKCFEVDNNGVLNCSTRENSSCGGGGGPVDSSVGNGSAATTTTATQNHRKARRCWSPDLHRRFVNALQMLGGSQVATPKQIRELMKVDGLTNDEVKSHLQKYRLHTRRPSPSPQAAGNQAPQLVVLGGIWVPPEYAAAAAAAHGGAPPTIYGAHPSAHGSQQYCVTSQVPQEFYAAPPLPPPNHQLHHHLHHQHQHQQNLHHQLQLYKASSQNHSSPESEVRVTGDRSESIEDGKSESSSWNKGDSGVENEGERERKGLVTLREEGSHGSEITLKF